MIGNRKGDRKRLLILGGYGNTGRPLAELLLRCSDASLVAAGRNLGKAQDMAAALNERFGDERVEGQLLDAADGKALLQAFATVDIVVAASSTAEYTKVIAEAALEAQIDYFDVNFSRHKLEVLKAAEGQIKEAGLCFITDGGFHPGLPAALIRHLGGRFDQVHSARVGSVIKIDWSSLNMAASTKEEFVGEFIDIEMLAFKDSQWKKTSVISMMKPLYMDFSSEASPPFGRQYCVPMFLEEMRAVPEIFPEISEAGFYIGGFNWVVDWLISPLIVVGLKLSPTKAKGPMSQLLFWGLKRFSKPPYGTLLKAEVEGTRGGEELKADMVLYHEDGYAFTAIPAAACLLQYLDGSIRQPGLWLQALAADPDRLMKDMERMGICIEFRETAVDLLMPD